MISLARVVSSHSGQVYKFSFATSILRLQIQGSARPRFPRLAEILPSGQPPETTNRGRFHPGDPRGETSDQAHLARVREKDPPAKAKWGLSSGTERRAAGAVGSGFWSRDVLAAPVQ